MAELYKKRHINLLIEKLKKDNPILKKKNKGIQYTIIDGPLQLLNMVYPNEAIVSDKKVTNSTIDKLYGRDGLMRLMTRNKNKRLSIQTSTVKSVWKNIFRNKKLKITVKKYIIL